MITTTTTATKTQDDVAKGVVQEHMNDQTDPKQERKLLWKLDLLLMPIMTITVGLQYYDKALLSSAIVFGALQDLDLRTVDASGNVSTYRYSWATSIFYFGYLIGSIPAAYCLQRFPLAKFLSLSVILWGIVVLCTIACTNFPGIMVQRFFLGVIESVVSPGFLLLTTMFYKKSEQPIRLGIWYSATGLFSIFSGVLNFAIGHAPGTSWHYMYALAGGFTTLWGVLCYVLLPDSPLQAPALLFTPQEKQLAVLRIRDESTGIESKQFKMYQVVEALLDPKVYAFFLLGAAIYVVNGGVTAFGAYIIKSFGYSSLQTLLLLTPGGATTMVSIYIAAWFAVKVPNSRIAMLCFTCLFPIVGACMIWKGDWSHRGVALVGYWFLPVFGAPYVMMLSLSTANIAGHTKKAFVSGAIFVAYNVGNIIGPYLVDVAEAPIHYRKTFISVIIVMVFSIVVSLLLFAYLKYENDRRDRAQHVDAVRSVETPEGEPKLDDGDSVAVAEKREAAFSDMTDMENPHFRYVW